MYRGAETGIQFIKVRINTEKGSEVRKLNYGGIPGDGNRFIWKDYEIFLI